MQKPLPGTPAYFVQVVIHEAIDTLRYINGRLHEDQIFIQADIRSGRTVGQKQRLMRHIVNDVSQIANVAAHHIWVYPNELNAENMLEFGEILPEAGKEDEWQNALDESTQSCINNWAI